MRRSAVLRDVPHAELESQLGNLLETGWVIHHAYPSTQIVNTSGPNGYHMVTHWTIFLETEITHPTEIP